jgi:hypothetical protein
MKDPHMFEDAVDIVVPDPMPPMTPYEKFILSFNRDAIRDLTAELCAMVENDPDRGTEYESAFLGEATKARTIEIGKELHDICGERAMLMVHAKVFDRCDAQAARMLEMAWDGIGEWLG